MNGSGSEGRESTHPHVPDELDYLTRVRVLVRRLRQPTDHGLDCLGTLSVAFRKSRAEHYFLTCFLLVAAKTGGAPGGL